MCLPCNDVDAGCGVQAGGIVASDYGDITLTCTEGTLFANNSAIVRYYHSLSMSLSIPYEKF